MSVGVGLVIGISWGFGLGFLFCLWSIGDFIKEIENRAKVFEEAYWKVQRKLNKSKGDKK